MIKHLPLLALLVIVVSAFCFRLDIPEQKNHIISSKTEYDNVVMLNAVKNYNREGLNKGWGFPSRRGLFIKDFYGIDGGCVENKDVSSDIEILDIKGDKVALNSMVRDCYYLHYPHLSFIYVYVLNKVGLIEEFNNSDLVMSYLPWQIVFFTLLFLLIYHITGLRWVALFIPVSYIFSSIYLDFQLSVGTPLFEMCFLLFNIFFVLKKKYHLCFVATFFTLFSGVDFLLPTILLQAYALRKIDYKLNKLSLAGTVGSVTFSLYFIGARFFIYDQMQLKEDFYDQIPLRVFGEYGFFRSIPRGIYSFFQEIGANYLSLYVVFTALIIVLGCGLYKKESKRFFHVFFCLFMGLSLFLIVPGTTVYHTFSKAQFLIFFYFSLLSYLSVDIVNFFVKKGVSKRVSEYLAVLSLLFLCLIDPHYAQRLRANLGLFENSTYNLFGNSHIVDFTISAEDTSGASLIGHRTQYMKGNIAAPSNRAIIEAGKFQVFMQMRNLKNASQLSFLIKDIQKLPSCEIFEVVNIRSKKAKLLKKNFNTKKSYHEDLLKLSFHLNDINSDFIRVDCDTYQRVTIERIWVD